MSADPLTTAIANIFLKAAGPVPEPVPDPELVALQEMSLEELKAAYGQAILETERRKGWYGKTCMLYARARQTYVDAPTDENMAFILSAECVKEQAQSDSHKQERDEWRILKVLKAKQEQKGD